MFANAVVSQLESAKARVRQWVCSQENHEEGGIHFHIAIEGTLMQISKSANIFVFT